MIIMVEEKVILREDSEIIMKIKIKIKWNKERFIIFKSSVLNMMWAGVLYW